MNTTPRKGFTLIELMVVIAILGFLILAGLSSFNMSLKKSRDSKRKNDLRQIAISLEAYQNDHNAYPDAAAGAIKGCADLNGPLKSCDWGGTFKDTNGTVYMTLLPKDPTDGQTTYLYKSDGIQFQLYSRLENTLDADIPKNSEEKPRAFSDVNCAVGASTVYCNYGVASSNISAAQDRAITYE